MIRCSLFIFLALIIAACGAKKEDAEAESKPIVEVTLGHATTADIPLTIDAPATVFAREQANISARTTAPIRKLLVRKGDSVRAGQLLAELENRDVLAQRAEAQGAVANAQATLQKTVSGTLPSDIERARGQVDTTRAALNQAQQVFTKRQALYEQGAIPQRDFLQTQTDLATARTNYEVAQRSYDLLVNQSKGRDEQIAKSNVQQAEARLQGTNAQLQFTELRAPFQGTVTEQFQYPGDMAQPTNPIFTIADLSSVNARAQVPEATAGGIRAGQPCSFRSIDKEDAPFGGRITVVNRAVDMQRRTVEVWCEIVRPPVWVRAGTFGTVSIQTGQVQNAVLVPKSALQLEEGSNQGAVFVVDAKRIAHKREVTAGATSGDNIQIVSGVKAGETIVIEGAYGLPDNAQVILKGERKPGKKEEKE